MKVVLLAGGSGTRLSEETVLRPKPMIEIGGMPILWHIMKIYSAYGFNEFIVCLGYKGYVIKEFFANYFMHRSDLTIDLQNNSVKMLDSQVEPWRITLVDTGLNSTTAERIKRIKPFVKDGPFMLTYGDGLGNVNIKALVEFHKQQGKLCTVTAVQSPIRFGAFDIDDGNSVINFSAEKPGNIKTWINGGFFVCQPEIFDYINEYNITWESKPMESLAKDNQLAAYQHHGFWKPLDTLREKMEMEEDWKKYQAKWKIW